MTVGENIGPPGCTCLHLPLIGSGSVPATRLLHATAVAVETCHGRIYRGAYLGTCWAGLPEARERLVLVRTEQGECYGIEADLVRRVEVDPGAMPNGQAGPALVEFATAVRAAGAPWDAVTVAERLDDTTDLVATVWFVDHHCEPGPDPRPKETRSPLATGSATEEGTAE